MKKIQFVGAAILCCSILSGCQSTAKQDYSQLTQTNQVALSNFEAINISKPIKLNKDKPTKSKLSLNDSVIQFGEYRSNYKLFEFNGSESDSYSVELRSLCDCLGFSKTVVYPIAYILDAKGNVVNDKPSQIGQGSMGFSYPMNIHGIWSGKLPEKGTYYLLVASDNRELGTTVSDVNAQMSSAPYLSISVPMTSDLQGELEVKLTLK